LWEAVQDGTIDSIATDHAPHTPGQKALPFDCSPNGVIGLETSLGVMLTDGYHTGRLSPLTLIQRMSSQPARLFHLPHAGQLAVGGKANLCIIDPDLPWVVTPDAFKSRSRNSPFSGKQLTGKAVLTMANGICLHDKLHPAS
jgi:dihydroorotase